MLQALIHKKLKASFVDPTFSPSEDTLTSSIIGLFQYLPSAIILKLLREACGISTNFPKISELGEVMEFRFWDKWDATSTNNSNYVEPDVWIRTTKYDIILEAKKTDKGGQHDDQWTNEIKAFLNTNGESENEVILLALGGNQSLQEATVLVDCKEFKVFAASWFNLMMAVSRESCESHPPHIIRLLCDVLKAFELHDYIKVGWIGDLKAVNISQQSAKTLSMMFNI
jgi:hypothetical protein